LTARSVHRTLRLHHVDHEGKSMLPTLALASAAIGLLLIIFLVFRELKPQLGGTERNMLAVVSVISLVVAAYHIIDGLRAGGGH
jgi:hypothetical protein